MKALLYRNIVILVYVLLLPLVGFAQRAGDLDRSFNYGRGENFGFNYGYGANGTVYCSNVQPDGKILIGGSFTNYNGASINKIARLNVDGSLDATFNTGTGPNGGGVASIALQSDSKIIIGGTFNSYNSTTRNRIARLNADGSLDTSFTSGLGANSQVETIAVQTDGKIIIGGNFTSYNGTTRNRIARLNADGSLDATFNPGTGANDWIYTTAVQADGKIIIGGNFNTYNGTNSRKIARLNADGSLDATFNRIGYGARSAIYSIAIQPNGKIFIGGEFRQYNFTDIEFIARLNSDGTLDTSFNPGTGIRSNQLNPFIVNIELQADGKIIIVGQFNSFNGNTSNHIARLNANGSLDVTFNSGTGANFFFYISNTALQPDGKIIIGGDFSAFNGTIRFRVARLNSDGSLDAMFNPQTGAQGIGEGPSVSCIALQTDGKILIGGGEFTSYNGSTRISLARLNIDGSLDNSFIPATLRSNVGTKSYIETIGLQPNGKMIIGGRYIFFNFSTSKDLARLNADGSLDTSFNTGTDVNGGVYTNSLQPDGKIIIGGGFVTYNGNIKNRIARLNADGSLDGTFNLGTGANSTVRTTAMQADGKIIIGGNFTSYNGTTRNYIARLNTDGSLDTTFNPGTGANNMVRTLALQADGKIIIGGNFTSYNGINRNYTARLNANGSLDTTFNPGSGANRTVFTIALQSDQKIIIGGDFTSFNGTSRNNIARLNANGSLDATFNPGAGVDNTVSASALQGDGKIIIGGYFEGYNNLSTPHIARIHGGDCPAPVSIIVTGNRNLCDGDPTTLTSTLVRGNLWSTGDTTRSITVSQAGTYTVRSMNNGCTSAISNPITVSVLAPPAPQIAFDSVGNRCLGSEIIVSVGGNHSQFRWNTGASTRSINVRRTGEYSVEVLDSSGCWSLPSRPARIVFDTAFCIIRISIIGLDSLEASIYADRYEWFLDGIQLLAGNNDKVIPIQGNGVYTVRAIIDGRTSPMSEPIVITSGKKSITTKFEVYPNPATNKVTVNTAGTGTLEILNSLGQVVITQPATATNEINLSKLAKGVYSVRFNGVRKMLVVK